MKPLDQSMCICAGEIENPSLGGFDRIGYNVHSRVVGPTDAADVIHSDLQGDDLTQRAPALTGSNENSIRHAAT